MRYRIYGNVEDPGSSGMCEADARTGDGTSMDDFNRKFDGSVPKHDFELPDAWFQEATTEERELFGIDPSEPAIVRWETAKIVQEAFTAGVEHGRDQVEYQYEALKERLQDLVRRYDGGVDTDDLISICEDFKKLVPPPSEENDEDDP